MRREHHTVVSDASLRLQVLDETHLSVFGIKLLSCRIEPPHKFHFADELFYYILPWRDN
jgi:hypothetical protein